MKRRHLLLTAATVIASPATFPINIARAAGGRVRLWAVRHSCGWTDAFAQCEAEAASLADCGPDEDKTVHPVEFIPSGRWYVFRFRPDDMDSMVGPYAVPEAYSLPPWAGETIAGSDGMSKREALAEMVRHNLRALAGHSDRWAVAVEAGEPVGIASNSLEFATGEYAVFSRIDYRPARVYRRGEDVLV